MTDHAEGHRVPGDLTHSPWETPPINMQRIADIRRCAEEATHRTTLNAGEGIVRMSPNDVLALCELAEIGWHAPARVVQSTPSKEQDHERYV